MRLSLLNGKDRTIAGMDAVPAISGEDMHEERNYGIDALRVAATMMVVIHHVLHFGGLLSLKEAGEAICFEAWLLEALSFGAVNCYALISGYIGVKRKPRIASLMTMWLQVAGYSTALVVAMELVAPERVNMSSWLTGLMPVVNNKYWYFTAYFLLFFMMPLLNELLTKGERSVLRRGIAVSLCALVGVMAIAKRDVFVFADGYSAAWLIMLYLVGGYLKLYGEEERFFVYLRQRGIWVYLGIALMMAAVNSVLLRREIGLPFGLKIERYRDLYNYMSVPVVTLSIALLAWFSAWRPSPRLCRWIGRLAPAAFGVYVIHMHPNVVEICITNRFAWLGDFGPLLMPLGVIAVSMVIYVICTAIDLIRMALFRLLRVRQLCQRIADFAESGPFCR